jgi:hypothetical protein
MEKVTWMEPVRIIFSYNQIFIYCKWSVTKNIYYCVSFICISFIGMGGLYSQKFIHPEINFVFSPLLARKHWYWFLWEAIIQQARSMSKHESINIVFTFLRRYFLHIIYHNKALKILPLSINYTDKDKGKFNL